MIPDNMTLFAFQDMARELIANAGYQVDAARSYAEVYPDGECHALECSVETWGSATFGEPRATCIYHQYSNQKATIWISIEQKGD